MKTAIRYKCRCMSEEVSIDVRARRKREDISIWMTGVQVQLGKDHANRSPLCRATKVEYLKLPVPEDGRKIGEGRENLN